MRIVVTGAAGFIGSHVVDHFLAQGHQILGLDNFSTGLPEFLKSAHQQPGFHFEELDLVFADKVEVALKKFKPDCVIHLAANADVRRGLETPRKDIEQGTLVTFNVLNAARLSGAKKFAYSSTGSVYGEATVFPTPENCPFPIQTSLYGASKLAGEALVQAFAEGYGMQGHIFRFVSILGERYTHGHVFDFIAKLKKDPTQIEVLGNGKQRKAYLYVGDCVSAISTIIEKCTDKVSVHNLGPSEYVDVDQSLSRLCKVMKLEPKRNYSGGERGWIGDSPFIFLDCQKLRNLGWAPTKTILDSVENTAQYLLQNAWIFDRMQK
jgi:UDP-glucose 4-epimerase